MVVDGPRDWGFPNPATPAGSSTYYSLRFAPADLRDDLAALHGWRHQVRAVLDQVSDPGVATAKLGWWREELQRTFAGTPTHPLSKRLAPLIDRLGSGPKPFLDLAWSTEAALTRHWPKDLGELRACAAQDLGALFELVLRLQSQAGGAPDPGQIARVRRLGAYCSIVYQIRDSGWLLHRGRLGFIPADRLRSLGLTPESLGQPAGRHQMPRLLGEVAQEARGLRGDGDDLADLPVTMRVRVRILDLLLAELEAVGFDLLDRRVGLTPIRKLWHAWRESRRP
jgi:phytoene synthase